MQNKRISKLEETLERVQKENKVNNLVIKGFDRFQDHPVKTAQTFLQSTLKADTTKIKIVSAKHFHSKFGQKTIVVTLGAKEEKAEIWKCVKNLKGSSYAVSDDLTAKQLENRNILLGKRRELLDNGTGKLIKVYDGKMVVDGKWYQLNESSQVVEVSQSRADSSQTKSASRNATVRGKR